MLGAYLGQRLVGAAMLRQKTHISLLFVDTTYQKKGIGRAFIRYFTALTKQRGGGSLTVNATPFAQQFYYRMGFQDAGPMEVKEGVRYYPMILSFGAVLT
jgi:GNAT superfamily N-acetyltransferase